MCFILNTQCIESESDFEMLWEGLVSTSSGLQQQVTALHYGKGADAPTLQTPFLADPAHAAAT